MEFPLWLTPAAPVWDNLPVAKIIRYPLEERDYMPYAQARLAADPSAVHLRMWAFETRPSAGSRLQAVFLVGGRLLTFASSPAGELAAHWGGQALAALGVRPELASFTGEDLQGEYWVALLSLPRQALAAAVGGDPFQPGAAIPGNFFKTDTTPGSAHCGSFFPADLALPDFCVPENLGVFRCCPQP